MLNSILFVAAMLLGGPSMPATQVTVEPQVVSAPVASFQAKMSAQVEKFLIEQRAAPHWHLSIQEAWTLYYDGLLDIEEIEVNYFYRLHYDGGILDVFLEGGI